MNQKFGRLVAMIVGLSSLHAVLCSGELGKPSLIIPPFALVGDYVYFRCRLPERHGEVIDFTFYSEEANISVEASLQRNEENASITVSAVLRNQGHFMCKAEVHNNTKVTSLVSDRVYFKVVEPIQEVLLTLTLGEFFEGDDLTLHCKVHGGGGISYMWLLDGVELEVTSNPLHIRGLTQRDAGSYACVAISKMEQEVTKKSNNVTVTVREMLSTPQITFTVRKGEDQYFADITCSSDRGSLPANFSLRTYNETSEEVLTRSAGPFLDASFSVLVSLGRSGERAQCWVRDGRSTLKSNALLLEVVPVGGAVHINLEYDIGHNFEVVGVTLRCVVEHGTHPIYHWYLNDSSMPVEAGEEFYRLSDDGRFLTLLNVHTPTSYRCKAMDMFDTSSNVSSTQFLIDQDVLKNHIPTEVAALVLGCSLLLVVLLTACCIYGAKYSKRQPPEKIQLNWCDSESDAGENEELAQDDYEEDLDLVRAANMDEEEEADVDSLEDWIGTE
ncbi:platelet endothelial cell adhesion molecule [Paramormyrops kingsleyae]|uniref:platelet endothelial cell adhesion molecule n=1 Tax=Paramormyrops kingsleyae TaxID=1676925 RepID=UPI003B97853B